MTEQAVLSQGLTAAEAEQGLQGVSQYGRTEVPARTAEVKIQHKSI